MAGLVSVPSSGSSAESLGSIRLAKIPHHVDALLDLPARAFNGLSGLVAAFGLWILYAGKPIPARPERALRRSVVGRRRGGASSP